MSDKTETGEGGRIARGGTRGIRDRPPCRANVQHRTRGANLHMDVREAATQGTPRGAAYSRQRAAQLAETRSAQGQMGT